MKKIPKPSTKRNAVQVPIDAKHYDRFAKCAAFYGVPVKKWIDDWLDSGARGDEDDMTSKANLAAEIEWWNGNPLPGLTAEERKQIEILADGGRGHTPAEFVRRLLWKEIDKAKAVAV